MHKKNPLDILMLRIDRGNTSIIQKMAGGVDALPKSYSISAENETADVVTVSQREGEGGIITVSLYALEWVRGGWRFIHVAQSRFFEGEYYLHREGQPTLVPIDGNDTGILKEFLQSPEKFRKATLTRSLGEIVSHLPIPLKSTEEGRRLLLARNSD